MDRRQAIQGAAAILAGATLPILPLAVDAGAAIPVLGRRSKPYMREYIVECRDAIPTGYSIGPYGVRWQTSVPGLVRRGGTMEGRYAD